MKLAAYASRIAILFLATSFFASGQSTPAFHSTDVHPDGSITFRFSDPAATKLELVLEDDPHRLPMQKSDIGIWSVTTPSLKPEIYGYRFAVDGQDKTVRDPQNSNFRYGNSLITVPGNPPQPWESTNVPQGNVTLHPYTTKIVLGLPQNQSSYVVYTPPGYNPKAKTRYPVLYLLHCWGDRPESWNKFGHANIIFDNLIAQRKIQPMIVVMPLGYGDMKFAFDYNLWDDPAAVEHNKALFTRALLEEVMPQVEHAYSVSQNRNDRAIIGASMGGIESLTIGLNHTDKFAWVGGISSALDNLDFTQHFGSLDQKTANLHLAWIACGTEDDLIQSNRKFIDWLKGRRVSVIAEERPGMHSYIFWRESLIQFATLIFRPQ